MRYLTFILLAAGLLVTGIVATSTSMTFQWPGFVLLGAAAIASITLLFRGRPRGASLVCLLTALVMTGYFLGRALNSPVAYFAREDAALAAACLVMYGLVATVFSSGKWRTALFFTLLLLVVANLGLATYQQLVDMGRWVFDGYVRTYPDRIGGVFNNPNHFAALLALSAPIFLSLAFFGKNLPVTVRLLLGFFAIMSLIAIGASRSRGGLLAAAIGLTVFGILALPRIWRQLDRGKLRAAFVVTFLIVVAGIGTVGALNFELVSQRFDDSAFSRSSETNRPLIWKAALAQNSEDPLFGTGSRTYYYYSRKYRSGLMHVSVPEAEFAHNEYVQLLADYGWIGLFAATLFGLTHLGNGIQFLRRKRQAELKSGFISATGDTDLALTIGAVSGLAAILSHACFDFVLHVPILALLSTLLSAILSSPGALPDAVPTPKSSEKPGAFLALLVRGICPGTGAALVIFGVVYTQSEWHFELARLAHSSGSSSHDQFHHLREARRLDPQNPFVHNLSGQAQLSEIDGSMPISVQDAYLSEAEARFAEAARLYPQNIFSAISYAEVLDSVNKPEKARAVLDNARKWAPLYGNVMQAQGEHWIRVGNLELAEAHFIEAREAAAFRDWRSALRSLEKINNLRRVAVTQANGELPDFQPVEDGEGEVADREE
ncbi:MAG: O-antigen ligase family protein [Verrucomicrobiales bacterium]|nr:O-antigen ligase family protein [Verrucomicrobiales bacterium]